MNNTISQSDCEMLRKVDFIQQPAMTNSVTGLRRSSKPLSKAKLAPKKGHGHWWSAACLIHYSFPNPAKTITSEKYAQQINEMHQLSGAVLDQGWSQFFCMTIPDLRSNNQHFKG